MLGKVMLTLYKPGDVGNKGFTHLDSDYENCSIENLVWGAGNVLTDFPDHLVIRGVQFMHSESFPGIYINADGKVYSKRDSRKWPASISAAISKALIGGNTKHREGMGARRGPRPRGNRMNRGGRWRPAESRRLSC